jgi:hypothetical protein
VSASEARAAIDWLKQPDVVNRPDCERIFAVRFQREPLRADREWLAPVRAGAAD